MENGGNGGLSELRALWQTAMRAFTRNASVRERLAVGGAALALLLVASLVVTLILALNAPVSVGAPETIHPTTHVATMSSTLAPTNTTALSPTATRYASPPPKAPPPPPAPPSPTPGGSPPICPTPTSLPPTPTSIPPTPSATATYIPTTTATVAPTASVTTQAMRLATNCVQCGVYQGNNPTQTQIASALTSAANKYGLPVNLLKAVAWQESNWHEDIDSCDGGIGLMQVQDYVYSWLNQQSVPECGLGATNDDPTTLQGNANLGAKMLKYLMCFWSYWGNTNGTSLSSPGQYTIDWYYQQAGLAYPDSYNASGSLNPKSFCAVPFNANSYYPDLPSTLHNPWSCPFSATTGDVTLLDVTVSAYNEGAGNVINLGINNWPYVNNVEAYVSQFAAGSLP